LEDSVKALDIILTEEEITYLEEAYLPHDIIGYYIYKNSKTIAKLKKAEQI